MVEARHVEPTVYSIELRLPIKGLPDQLASWCAGLSFLSSGTKGSFNSDLATAYIHTFRRATGMWFALIFRSPPLVLRAMDSREAHKFYEESSRNFAFSIRDIHIYVESRWPLP